MTMGNGSPLKQSMIYLLVWGAAPLCAQPLPYPVRNGAFERVDGWSRPQHWGTHVMDGEHQFRYPTDAPDGARYVEITSQSGKARWYQLSVPVFAGSYRLTFRARGTPGATGHVLVAGDGVDEAMTVQPTETWQDFAMEVNVPQSGAVGLYLHSLAPGTVAYDDVALEEVRMESGPVPTDGKPLAAVIRPEDPTPAERFAAYELQRVLHAVTGVHLALAGRDEVGEGRLVYLGRAVPEALLDRAELTGEEAYAAVVRPPPPQPPLMKGGIKGGSPWPAVGIEGRSMRCMSSSVPSAVGG